MGEKKEKKKEKKDKEKKKEKEKATVRSAPDGSDNKKYFSGKQYCDQCCPSKLRIQDTFNVLTTNDDICNLSFFCLSVFSLIYLC